MKLIYVIPISTNFDCSCKVEHEPVLHMDYVKGYEPPEDFDESKAGEESFYLMRNLPEGAMKFDKPFVGFDMAYTDNYDVVKQKWYSGVISSFNHVARLERGGLAKIIPSAHQDIHRVVDEANKHRDEHPELWI